MRLFFAGLLSSAILVSAASTGADQKTGSASSASSPIFGFRNATSEAAIEKQFLAVPDPKLAEEHLRTLTQAPHMAGTPEDKATADYVARKFREAGLDTEIVEY